MKSLKEKTISSKKIYKGNLLDLRKDKVSLPNNEIGYREWINHPGAACCLPILDKDRIVLTRQYRYAVGEESIEIPAGKLDSDETSEECAYRELREETGYIGSNPKYLGYVDPNPAFQTNKCHTVLIQNCEKLDEQDLDPGEDIEVEVASEKSIQKYIDEGTIRHSLVLSAFRLYEIEKTS